MMKTKIRRNLKKWYLHLNLLFAIYFAFCVGCICMCSHVHTRNENDERRLLIWQFARYLLIIFTNISMAWGVK
jgi:hypothetical protein